MAWSERKSTSDLLVLGDDEGQVRKVGGLLADIRQDTKYPSRSNYLVIQKNGDEVWLAGSASLGNQLGPADVGKFFKAEFTGWGASPNGKFKIIKVDVWEGDPLPEMKQWPRYREIAQGAQSKAKPEPKHPDDFEPDEDGQDLPFD